MAGWLVVLVDNKEYVPVSRLREADSGAINLTTMLPDQDQAHIELFFRGPRYLEQIHTFHLSGLHQGPERPRIVVSAHRRDALRVTLRVDGELREEQSFAVPEEVHRIAWLPVILIAAAVLVLAGFGVAAGMGLFSRSGPQARLDGQTISRSAEAIDRVITPLEEIDPVADGEATDSSGEPAAEPIPVEQTVYFEPESAVLLPEAVALLNETAELIAESDAPPALEAVGHTALFGNAPARQQLSEERAAEVARTLRALLAERGMENVEISASGVGGSQPVTTAEDEQWRNRRVELTGE